MNLATITKGQSFLVAITPIMIITIMDDDGFEIFILKNDDISDKEKERVSKYTDIGVPYIESSFQYKLSINCLNHSKTDGLLSSR